MQTQKCKRPRPQRPGMSGTGIRQHAGARLRRSAMYLATALFCTVLAVPAQAQEATATEEEIAQLDQIIVTGTRVRGRVPTESISPIDVFYPTTLERQSSPEFTDQLANIAPSFNTQRFPIADGTAFIRPASLRNLPPDQTLVLINGKRRHRSALVNLQVEPFGTVNQGAQAVDFGLIPAAAIQRVEVLRDGSSAQYGSDAIAGVINIILNDYSSGLKIDGQYGSTYEGDGDKYRASLSWGTPLTSDGFFNLTAEYFNNDFTSRGHPRADAAVVGNIVGRDRVPFNGLGQRWGDPNAEGIRLFFNSEIGVSDSVRAYAFGSYADQDFDSSFFYRTPVGVPGIRPRGTLMVDSDGDGQPDPVDQALVNAIIARGLNPADYLTPSATSPSGWVALNPIHTRFPGGYTPTFGAEIEDFETVLGIRGESAGGLRWDLSGRLGENRVAYLLRDSINPSLGRLSPTEFRPGTLTQRERGVNLDFAYALENSVFAAPLNIAFGAEWRSETYIIGQGDPASYESGPTALLFGVGSDGFQGDGPESAGRFSQNSWATYLDLETDPTDRLTVGLAGRVEESAAFDTHFDWKVSARFQASETFALRGTVNTGFRAPTPGQANTLDVTTTADASGTLVPLGTFPVSHPASVALGSRPLEVEESFAYSAGIVYAPSRDFTVTLDYYNIDVDDRIALASFNIEPGSPEQQRLIDAGVPGAELLGFVSFFTNAFDTTVEGVDLVANYRADFGEYGWAIFDARHSYNKQKVRRFDPGTIDEERVFDLENQLPRNRSVLTFDYRSPWNVDLLVRANRYSGWQDFTFGERASFGSKWLFDLAATWHIRDRFHLTVGGQNIFDTYPDRETNGVLNFLGLSYPLSSPFGFNGGEWYVRLSVDVW